MSDGKTQTQTGWHNTTFAKPTNGKNGRQSRRWSLFLCFSINHPFATYPIRFLSLPLFPSRHALNIKYKLETITVNKMLTLKFQVPAPSDILLTVVIESHTPQREAKILWYPSGGRKKTKQIPYSLHLFVMFVLDKPLKCPKFIYTHTCLLPFWEKSCCRNTDASS